MGDLMVGLDFSDEEVDELLARLDEFSEEEQTEILAASRTSRAAMKSTNCSSY